MTKESESSCGGELLPVRSPNCLYFRLPWSSPCKPTTKCLLRHSKQTIRAKRKKKVLGGLFWESWNFSPQVNFNLSTKLNICAGDINDIRFNREIISYSICKKEWDFVLAFDRWGAWLLSMGGEEGDGAEGRRTWGSVGCGCRIDVDNGRRWNRKLCFRW